METKENVPVKNIEQELANLRKICQEKKTVQACLFNLIIYTQEPRRTIYFQELVQRVIEKFPCRIIFIESNNDASDYLESTVSTETIGEGETAIICEQITLKVSGKKRDRIPFIILTNLVPDLPVYLIWGEDPIQKNEILDSLQKIATSVIFDSESTDNLQHFSQVMFDHAHSADCDIIDMNWMRISSWRDVIAKTFDTPEKIRQLQHAQSIQINYNDKTSETFRHQKIQSTFLQAWLAAQLKWHFTSIESKGETIQFNYNNIAHHPLTIEIIPQSRENLSPGTILGVNVVTEEHYHFEIIRKDDTPFVTVTVSTEETCEVPVRLPLLNHQRRFAYIREMFYGCHSDQYPNMLKMLTKQECPT